MIRAMDWALFWGNGKLLRVQSSDISHRLCITLGNWMTVKLALNWDFLSWYDLCFCDVLSMNLPAWSSAIILELDFEGTRPGTFIIAFSEFDLDPIGQHARSEWSRLAIQLPSAFINSSSPTFCSFFFLFFPGLAPSDFKDCLWAVVECLRSKRVVSEGFTSLTPYLTPLFWNFYSSSWRVIGSSSFVSQYKNFLQHINQNQLEDLS